MKPLTFKGYLKQYIKELSLCDSSSVHKLDKEADRNYRLVAPLAMYIHLTADKPLRKFNSSRLNSALQKLESVSDLESALENGILEEDFQKVYAAYKNRTNKKEYDNQTKQLMLAKIKRLQKEKGVTNYRIYKDLLLNPGNANDFLTNGNVSKMSVETAEKVLKYLMG